jgi:hypothetical protein
VLTLALCSGRAQFSGISVPENGFDHNREVVFWVFADLWSIQRHDDTFLGISVVGLPLSAYLADYHALFVL